MRKLMLLRFILTVIVFVFTCTQGQFTNASSLQSEAEASRATSDILKQAPKVYIDCDRCDMDYIRTEITFVSYVRDSKDAQVYVLITTQSTGSSGREYNLSFSGQKEFEGVNNEFKYFSNNTDTSDEVREGLVKFLKIGLVSYAARTSVADMISVSFESEEIESVEKEDKWDYWVFSISGRGFIDGEKMSDAYSLSGSFSANRITPDFKFRSSYSTSKSEDNFYLSSGTFKSTSRSKNFNLLAVKSLTDHWSAGVGLSAYSSTYSNMDYAFKPAPALEYNFFPYSESTRRQLRFLWKPGFNMYKYNEETIYNKTSENMWGQSLSITFEMKEKWGNIGASLQGFHYFNDLQKNNLRLNADVSIRLFRGLSFNIYGGFRRIRDQISLPKGGASLEEVLLRQTQLATGYSYYGSIGLSYSFGSIYSNIVNPRFSGY
ncbi:hypothetical protein ACFL6W_03065 [Thermodesulfobacteriota bacterium]